ncbi:MAG: sensor histidine kinase [Eubacteriales bacterium]
MSYLRHSFLQVVSFFCFLHSFLKISIRISLTETPPFVNRCRENFAFFWEFSGYSVFRKRHSRDERRRCQNGDNELKDAITNLSHDLRTPITALSGYLELLRREDMSENAARYLAVIENRIGALHEMAESLFDYSVSVTVDHSALETVVLNRAVEEAVSSCYALLVERGITPEIALPEERVGCILNRAALSRILENIIVNAVKYSDGDLSIVLRENGEIVFTNHAASLDETAVGRLFDRFYTVENGRKSTGLGLSIAKTLTEQMGGRISAVCRGGLLSLSVRFSGTR